MYIMVKVAIIGGCGITTWKLIEQSTPATIAVGIASGILTIWMVIDLVNAIQKLFN